MIRRFLNFSLMFCLLFCGAELHADLLIGLDDDIEVVEGGGVGICLDFLGR